MAGLVGVANACAFTPTPDDLAVFDTTPADAATVLCTDEATVHALGLRQVDGLFDYTDVVNAALHSGTGKTLPELGRRLLMRFAAGESHSWFSALDWTVTVRQVPADELFRVAVPDLDADGVEVVDDPAAEGVGPTTSRGHQAGSYTARVRLAGERFAIADRRVRAAFDEVMAALDSGAVHYQAIAEPLRRDHQRAWSLGVADCVVSGKVLADLLRDKGLRARARRGYLLGLVGNDHGWCEVLLDGQWRGLDPLFAYLAAAHGRDGGAEFRDACLGSRFNRLLPCAVDDSESLFLRLDGSPAPTWAFSIACRLNREEARHD